MIPIIKIPRPVPIPPRQSGFSRWFWDSLSQGRFETTQCQSCARLSFPPREVCPDCMGDRYKFIELSGRGVVYTRTLIHMVPTRLIPIAPLSLGLVDLEEGLRIACTLIDRDQRLEIGSLVQISTMKFTDGVLFGAALRRES